MVECWRKPQPCCVWIFMMNEKNRIWSLYMDCLDRFIWIALRCLPTWAFLLLYTKDILVRLEHWEYDWRVSRCAICVFCSHILVLDNAWWSYVLLRGCLAWQVRTDGPNSLDGLLWPFLQTWQAAASTFSTWYLLIDSPISAKESISFCDDNHTSHAWPFRRFLWPFWLWYRKVRIPI